MKQKDFETLVHAFSVVRNTRVVRLLILGEGADRPQLVELGQRLVSPMNETSSRFAHRDQERTNAQHVHGFCVLSEFADLHYKVTQLYDHEDEAGLIWNDRDVGIRWPLAKPIVSERDSAYPGLRQLDPSHLPQFVSPT